MELLLTGVTLVSLGLATSLAAVAWKLIRDHHRFAAARVDALVALAAGAEPHEASEQSAPGTPVEISFDAPGEVPMAVEMGMPLFASTPARGVGRRRSLALATVGLAMAAVVAAIYASHASGATFLSAVLRAASRADTPAPALPLELRGLQHTIDDAGTFVVSGIVTDPKGGRTFEDVAAVVYLFDEDGVCFANGRAAIDVATLRAGTESAFEVRLHATAPVSRYRVGFRRADGVAVPHVDKRQGHGGT